MAVELVNDGPVTLLVEAGFARLESGTRRWLYCAIHLYPQSIRCERWAAGPPFFRPRPTAEREQRCRERTEPSEIQIENRDRGARPAVELIALERPSAETLRLFIDHPDGVALELCERVTTQLRDLLADYALEVSSPGLDRPLTKPEHFERFLGREVRVRTAEPIDGQPQLHRPPDGRRRRGDQHRVRARGGARSRSIAVSRSNLVPELSEVHS